MNVWYVNVTSLLRQASRCWGLQRAELNPYCVAAGQCAAADHAVWFGSWRVLPSAARPAESAADASAGNYLEQSAPYTAVMPLLNC